MSELPEYMGPHYLHSCGSFFVSILEARYFGIPGTMSFFLENLLSANSCQLLMLRMR
jgi:hypothetical protein